MSRHATLELHTSSHPPAKVATALIEQQCVRVAAPKLHDRDQGHEFTVLRSDNQTLTDLDFLRREGLFTSSFRNRVRTVKGDGERLRIDSTRTFLTIF